jgi:hypothetical protein
MPIARPRPQEDDQVVLNQLSHTMVRSLSPRTAFCRLSRLKPVDDTWRRRPPRLSGTRPAALLGYLSPHLGLANCRAGRRLTSTPLALAHSARGLPPAVYVEGAADRLAACRRRLDSARRARVWCLSTLTTPKWRALQQGYMGFSARARAVRPDRQDAHAWPTILWPISATISIRRCRCLVAGLHLASRAPRALANSSTLGRYQGVARAGRCAWRHRRPASPGRANLPRTFPTRNEPVVPRGEWG